MAIRGEERRAKIIEILNNATAAVKGSELAEQFGVSRQVIVNDIAILRAAHPDLMAVKAGYTMMNNTENRRVFKSVRKIYAIAIKEAVYIIGELL